MIDLLSSTSRRSNLFSRWPSFLPSSLAVASLNPLNFWGALCVPRAVVPVWAILGMDSLGEMPRRLLSGMSSFFPQADGPGTGVLQLLLRKIVDWGAPPAGKKLGIQITGLGPGPVAAQGSLAGAPRYASGHWNMLKRVN